MTTVTRYSDAGEVTAVGKTIYGHDDAGKITSINHQRVNDTVCSQAALR
jgi:hypothetical protein